MYGSTPGLHVHHHSQSSPKLMSIERWCHPTISFSVVPFSAYPQSFPVSGSFQMTKFFTSGGKSTGVSASRSILPMNIQDWSPLGWTSWIFLESKGLSRVFSNTVQKHQFFSAHPSSQSNSNIRTWPQEKLNLSADIWIKHTPQFKASCCYPSLQGFSLVVIIYFSPLFPVLLPISSTGTVFHMFDTWLILCL